MSDDPMRSGRSFVIRSARQGRILFCEVADDTVGRRHGRFRWIRQRRRLLDGAQIHDGDGVAVGARDGDQDIVLTIGDQCVVAAREGYRQLDSCQQRPYSAVVDVDTLRCATVPPATGPVEGIRKAFINVMVTGPLRSCVLSRNPNPSSSGPPRTPLASGFNKEFWRLVEDC